MPMAETRPERIEFYIYTGQPRSEWPAWLRLQFTREVIDNRDGHFAVAGLTDAGPYWWRWFTPEKFNEMFRLVNV